MLPIIHNIIFPLILIFTTKYTTINKVIETKQCNKFQNFQVKWESSIWCLCLCNSPQLLDRSCSLSYINMYSASHTIQTPLKFKFQPSLQNSSYLTTKYVNTFNGPCINFFFINTNYTFTLIMIININNNYFHHY